MTAQPVDRRALCGALLCLALAAVPAAAATWRVEAEQAGPGRAWPRGGSDYRRPWTVENLADASGGAVLAGVAANQLDESRWIAFPIPAAGRYCLWARYKTPPKGKHVSLAVMVRDDDGENTVYAAFDLNPRLPTERPYLPAAPEEPAESGDGWTWAPADVRFERPMRGFLSFGAAQGLAPAPRAVDCVVVTDNLDFDPLRDDWRALPKAPDGPVPTSPIPAGLVPAKPFIMHTSFFAGAKDPREQIILGIITGGLSAFVDDALAVQLGFNRDHGAGSGSLQYGILTIANATTFFAGDAQLAKDYPPPAGRFVNSEGKVGRQWSLSFKPLREAAERELIERVRAAADRPEVERWRICGEHMGNLDYSEPALEAFREWLKRRYEVIGRLNAIWKTAYDSFESVSPPKSHEENKAAWFDFHAFSGQALSEAVGAQIPVIRRLDPKGRPCFGQNTAASLLHAASPVYRPHDFEQFIEIALADEPVVAWDDYCADDYMGCNMDLLQSLAGKRSLTNAEWNIHASDPRIAGRTFWTMIGKGIKGIDVCGFQDALSGPKWGLIQLDLTPKDKLGALSDAAQETHRLERLLVPARRRHTVKPVALYYSRLDMALPQPLAASAWSEGVNSPYHVYETLRGQGYPVTWVTPKQILAGALDAVSAVVMVNTNHVPAAAAARLAEWVRGGGVVIGDSWPGAFDEHGRPQATLAEVFGVRLEAPAAPTGEGKLALEESVQGYGEVTIRAIELDPTKLHTTASEIFYQWDATHPVARKMKDFLLSGYGKQNIQCAAGQVIGMFYGGKPGMVINQYGRGHSLYVAMMLGTLYEGSATRYEWSSAHAGTGYGRLLDAFLRHAGVTPFSEADLNERLAAKLRVESPLVDGRGNALVPLVSFNDAPLPEFDLRLRWPAPLPAPKMALFVREGRRSIVPLRFALRDGVLRATVPAFDSHGTILALNEADPLIGFDLTGIRGAAGLVRVRPGARLTLTATVWNPSDKPLPPGRISLHAPRGWFCDAAERPVGAVGPWGRSEAAFDVVAPALCNRLRLRPLMARYEVPDLPEALATEMIWWTPAP